MQRSQSLSTDSSDGSVHLEPAAAAPLRPSEAEQSPYPEVVPDSKNAIPLGEEAFLYRDLTPQRDVKEVVPTDAKETVFTPHTPQGNPADQELAAHRKPQWFIYGIPRRRIFLFLAIGIGISIIAILAGTLAAALTGRMSGKSSGSDAASPSISPVTQSPTPASHPPVSPGGQVAASTSSSAAQTQPSISTSQSGAVASTSMVPSPAGETVTVTTGAVAPWPTDKAGGWGPGGGGRPWMSRPPLQ